jgi:hypothetical protein
VAQNPSKKRRAITSAIYTPYVVAIGQLALAWNDLHEALALLFIELLANGRAYPATDLWNAASFDRPKRQLIKSLMRTAPLKYPARVRLKADLEWLLAEIDKVEDARNDAIHAPLTFSTEGKVLSIFTPGNKEVSITIPVDKIVPSTAFDNRRAIKLLNKDLLTEFRWCRDMSLALTEYVSEIYEAVAANPPDSNVWPTKPVLPGRGMKKRRKSI